MKLLRLRIILAALTCTAALQTPARTLTWTGEGFPDSTSWSKSGNWSPSFVPADGDSLIFPGSASTTTSFNDLVNLHVFSITFNGSSGSTLNGNSIFLDSAITCNHTGGRARVNFDLTFTTGGVTFYTFSDGYLDIEQNVFLGNNDLYLYPLNANPSGTNIEVHGVISGTGGLTKLGNGDAYLVGAFPNDYTGQTTVSAGNLHLAKSGVTAISDRMVIGVNTTAGCLITDHADGQYPAGIAVTIGNTGWWTINHSTTVTNLTLSHGIIDGPGTLSLLSDVTFLPEGPTYVSCPLYLGNVTRTFNLPSNAQLIMTGVVIGPGLGNNSPGIIKQGAGDLHLGGANSYFGPTIIQDGSLWVENNAALGSFAGAEAGTTVESGKIILNILPNGTVNEPVVMAGGEFKFTGAQTLNGSLVLSNYVYFSGLDQYSLLQINSVISGPGTMEVNGGTVQFGGSTPNTFGPGGVRVFPRSAFPATLELAKPDNVLSVPGGAYVEGSFPQPAVLRNLHDGGVTNVFIFNGGVWQLNGHTAAPNSLLIGGNGTVDATGSGQLQLNYSGTSQFHVYPFSGGISALVTGTVACVTGIDDITVDAGCSLNIAGPVIGGGALRKLGAGTLKLSGSTGNSYSGGTLVSEGTLELRKSISVPAVPGSLIIGPVASNSLAVARFFQNSGMPQGSAVTVNGNSLLDLNGFGQILGLLNLNDGGDVQTGGGLLTFSAGSSINVDTLDYVFGLRASASISGNVDLPHFDTVTCNVTRYDISYVSTQPELDVPANISGNGDLHKSGAGQMRLSGNNTFNDSPPTSAGNVQVLGGTLIAASATALGGTGGVTFVDTAGILALDGGITITGEPLSLFSTNAPGLASLSSANTWAGDIRFFRDSIVGVNAGGSLLINGTIFGTGGLTKINPGLLTLGGIPNNTYSGDTFANEGTLVLDKVAISGVITVPHHLTVGTAQTGNTATLMENDSACIAGSVTVNNGGLWILGQGVGETFQDFELQGHEPLTLNGNAQVQGPGFLYLPPGGGIVVNPGSNSTATVSTDIGIGTLLAGPTSHPVAVNAGSFQSGNPECVINGSISPLFDVTGLQKEGAGTLRLTGTNSYAGTNLVNGGTLWVDGVQPQSAVNLNTGTRLKGSGIVGNINLIGNSATISPGASPGILTCSNFNASGEGKGTLQIELNGTTPGSGYDQINVRGIVNLSGMSLSRSLGFASSTNDQFTIINNDGTDPVTNTFGGLPQNAKLYAGDQLFQVTYTGGSGNDVVLARLFTPPPPVLTIQAIKTNSVRLMWATNDPQFRLLTINSLTTNNWDYALPPAVITGTNNVITNLIILPQKFYKLTNQ